MTGGLQQAARAAAGNATAIGYLSGWRLVRLLPERSARRLFDRIADRAYRRGGRGVRQLRRNLSRVRPEVTGEDLDALTHAAVRSYLRYWCEAFRLPSWPIEDVVSRVRTVDEHILRDAYARGDGVVIPLPHMANWDWAGAWACATGMPLATVAERLEPERLFERFVAYRRSLGMQILPLTRGRAQAGSRAMDAPVLDRLGDWLSSGGLVCLLADRDLSRSGVEVRLCGEPARMPLGPAVLARRTGAALVPATLAYRGRNLEITFHATVRHQDGHGGLVSMMQTVADAFSRGVRAHPEDWHMMQKVFVADLAPGRV